MDTLARAPGGQMRGAATQAMSDIVEDPELRPGRAPRLRPAGLQPNANLFLREPLVLADTRMRRASF